MVGNREHMLKVPRKAFSKTFPMQIRKATANDAEAIARHLLDAMEDIVYAFIGERDHAKAYEFMSYFTGTENNQYSYENCRVAEVDRKVVGAINVYDGALLAELRRPVVQYIRNNYKRDFPEGDETGAGEYYLDTLSVDKNFRCRGIGSGLLQFVIDEYVHRQHKILGLLVDDGNPDAKRLYLKLGFKPAVPKILFGKQLAHLQISPANDFRN